MVQNVLFTIEKLEQVHATTRQCSIRFKNLRTVKSWRGSKRYPVQITSNYISYLNPERNSLFQNSRNPCNDLFQSCQRFTFVLDFTNRDLITLEGFFLPCWRPMVVEELVNQNETLLVSYVNKNEQERNNLYFVIDINLTDENIFCRSPDVVMWLFPLFSRTHVRVTPVRKGFLDLSSWNKTIIWGKAISLVWYILKQLFSSVSVNSGRGSVNIHHYSPLLR